MFIITTCLIFKYAPSRRAETNILPNTGTENYHIPYMNGSVFHDYVTLSNFCAGTFSIRQQTTT